MRLSFNNRYLAAIFFIVSISLLVWCIANAFQMPIYPDEIANKIFLERFFINGGFKQSLMPYCSEGFLTRPAASLIPAAMAWSLVSKLGIGFLSYRLIPILCWSAIFATLFFHGRRHHNQSFWPLMLVLTFGPAVYGLVIFRPEIVLLTAAALIYFAGSSPQKNTTKIYLTSGFLILLLSLVLYMHPKAVYLAPAVIATFIFSAKNLRSGWTRFSYIGISTAVLLLLTINAIHLHQLQYLTCARYPSITEVLNTQAINPLELFTNPSNFWMKMKGIFSPSLWTKTVHQLSYSDSYEVRFLPDRVTGTGYQAFDKVKRFVITGLLFLVSAITLFKIIYQVLKTKYHETGNEHILLLLIALGLIGPFFFNLQKHFYDVSLLIGAIAILASFSWSLPSYRPANPSAAGKAVRLFFFPLIFVVTGAVAAALNESAFIMPINAGYEGPSIAIRKMADRKNIIDKLNQAFLEQGIDRKESLIVDDVSYDLVKSHPIVYPFTYLILNQQLEKDLPDNLKEFNVHYGVARCTLLPFMENLVAVKVLAFLPNKNSNDICLFKL